MHTKSPAEKRRTKLDLLVESEGYDTLEDLLQAVITDSVSPGICMTEGCSYTTEVEPDQCEGWCEVCNQGTVASALVLAEII
jgi:hypothetical protein